MRRREHSGGAAVCDHREVNKACGQLRISGRCQMQGGIGDTVALVLPGRKVVTHGDVFRLQPIVHGSIRECGKIRGRAVGEDRAFVHVPFPFSIRSAGDIVAHAFNQQRRNGVPLSGSKQTLGMDLIQSFFKLVDAVKPFYRENALFNFAAADLIRQQLYCFLDAF